jgi:hypothetical protein
MIVVSVAVDRCCYYSHRTTLVMLNSSELCPYRANSMTVV